MREFIEAEMDKIRGVFEPFNTRGSWMKFRDQGEDWIRLGLVDGFTVTRVAPHFDASGEVKKVDFWLLFKMAGYDEGFQHAHTVKVVEWSQQDTYLIDMTDDRGREYHVELIFPDLEPDLAADWRGWQKYKTSIADRIARIDEELLAEHVQIAEDWE